MFVADLPCDAPYTIANAFPEMTKNPTPSIFLFVMATESIMDGVEDSLWMFYINAHKT